MIILITDYNGDHCWFAAPSYFCTLFSKAHGCDDHSDGYFPDKINNRSETRSTLK